MSQSWGPGSSQHALGVTGKRMFGPGESGLEQGLPQLRLQAQGQMPESQIPSGGPSTSMLFKLRLV